MKKLSILSLLAIPVFAHATCGDLNIKVINNSSHDCVFKNKVMYYGKLPISSIPTIIPAKQSSPIFSAHQDYIGVGVLLTYMCDNEVVKFYSYQNYCSIFGASDIGGQPYDATTLNLEYRVKMGSSIAGSPGQITWTIS